MENIDRNIARIADKLQLPSKAVASVISLLADGATIPFIARYRKEATGALDETQIFAIQQLHASLIELDHRRQHILETIAAQGALTPELEAKITDTDDAATLEDLYLPYKPKRRTRAQIAREQGLEPLARIIMSQNPATDISNAARRYVNDTIADTDEAIAGASDIIAEWVSEHRATRESLRRTFARDAQLVTRPVKGKEAEAEQFRNYAEFSRPLRQCQSHQVLAILRADSLGIMRFDLKLDDTAAIDRITRYFIKKDGNRQAATIIGQAVTDAYKRLLRPSIETETIAAAKLRADQAAIATFADNLRQLLMAPPLGAHRVLAIDPGFRTGCKVACLDSHGSLLRHDVIYPTPPHNDTEVAAAKLSVLINRYNIEAISLGNGTASRETHRFLQQADLPDNVAIHIVNEAGASVYSASKIARDEFPDEDVTVRGAVSIGRRLIDPLAELVKIEPKSIGVGQYQHDVDQRLLKESLDMTVASCVNAVGVDINTASPSLLAYVSGIGPAMADKIVAYRNANGSFASRHELLKVPRLGEKIFAQAAGFIRIPGAANPLDNSAVHPESYHIVERIAADLGVTVADLIAQPALLDSIDLNQYVTDKVGLPTLTDIVAELRRPGRDPRQQIEQFEFDPTIKVIEDLHEGMKLPGIVNNITDFGAFVDIGIHESGLIHISQMASRRPRHPSDIVRLNQHLTVTILSVDIPRRRIALTLL